MGDAGNVAGQRPRILSGGASLKRVRLQSHRPQAKEGLSLINGTQVSTAILADALVRARHLAKMADVAGAMTVEATKSSQRPFDARLQEVRPHPGQIACAANLRRLLADSQIMVSHAECGKVKDAYSMRCMPHPGLNSGMMLVQVLAAALVAESRSFAFPASVDSIPTSANREDHVSMSTTAARKARLIVTNSTRILACELLCAAQGLEFHQP